MTRVNSIFRVTCINRSNSKLAYGLALIVLISLVIGSVTNLPQVFATPAFGSTTPITTDDSSTVPQIAANGTNVYAVYRDANTGIGFSASSDNGATFPNNKELNFDGGPNSDPHVAAWGNNVYVVWKDSCPNIAFAASTDGGTTFINDPSNGPTEVSTDCTSANSPRVAAYGNNVYLAWVDSSNNLVFINSTDNGATFNPDPIVPNSPTQLSTGTASSPQIVAVAGHVYVTYVDAGNVAVDSFTDSGTGAISPIHNVLSSDSGSSTPQITANGNNVYVVWKDATGNIAFSSSLNDGASFSGTPTQLGVAPIFAGNPQVAANNTNVFVVWQNGTGFPGNREIFFSNSTNQGSSFHIATNLSKNSGNSVSPQIALFNNNVYITWHDATYNPTGTDILFKSSSTNGDFFHSVHKLTATSDITQAKSPIIATSGPNTYVAWTESTGSVSNIEFAAATTSPIDITFDSPQYKLTDNATITVKDPPDAALSSIQVQVTSTSDPTGISALDLAATSPGSGIFTGVVTFGSSTSGTVLQADAGDTITATKSGQNEFAAIFPRVVQWDAATHDYGDFGKIIVTDQNSNLDKSVAEKITATLTSNAAPAGTPIVLNETGPDTGVFGSTSSDKVIFMIGDNSYPLENTFTISHTQTGGDPAVVECVGDTVSTSSGELISVKVNETSASSNIFQAPILVTSGISLTDRQIHAVPGDIISVTSTSPAGCNPAGGPPVHGLVVPNPNNSLAAIQVTGDTADTVTASYGVKTGTVTIDNYFGPGGGSGGFLRPGLILNVVASLSRDSNTPVPPLFSLSAFASIPGALPEKIKDQVLNTDPTKPISAFYDNSFDYPLIIDGGGYLLTGYANTIQTKTETIGVPTEIKLNLPATGLSHLALYTNLRGDQREIQNSDTSIIYDKGQKLQITDPNGYFGDVKFDLSTQGSKNQIVYTITFAKPMEKSDLILRAWNDRHATADVKILNALEVGSSSSQTGPTNSAASDLNAKPEVIPPVLTPVIKGWGGFTSTPVSDSELLSSLGIEGNHIPSWVTKTSKWVVDGEMSEQEFVTMLKYLSSNGIVK